MQIDNKQEAPTSGPEDIKPDGGTPSSSGQRDKMGKNGTRVPSDADQYGSRNRPEGGAYSDHDTRDNSPQI